VLVGCGGDDAGSEKHNQAPSLAGPAALSLQQGRPESAPLEVSDPENDAVSVTVTSPQGIEASVSSELVLDAYPDYSVSGAISLPLVLTDARGASAEASLNVEVAPIRWLDRLTWTTEGPEAREHAAMVVDEIGKRIVMIGGSGYAPQGTPLGDVWQLDLTTRTWSELTPSGDVLAPAGSRRVAQVPGQPIAYLFGGYGTGFAAFNDLYRVDLSGSGVAFTKLEQTSPPPARSLHGFAYDRQTERFFAFAGIGNTILSDLWQATLVGDAASWTKLSPEPAPSPRYGFFYGTDSENGRVLLFSGATGTTQINAARDTWALDMRADPPVWTLVSEGEAQGVPPGRRNGCFGIDPLGPRLFVWGGTADGQTTSPGLFAFDARPGKEHWSELTLSDEPPLRSSGMAAYDPVSDRIWLGFGNDASVYQDLTGLGY
jgi:hypothetical protein